MPEIEARGKRSRPCPLHARAVGTALTSGDRLTGNSQVGTAMSIALVRNRFFFVLLSASLLGLSGATVEAADGPGITVSGTGKVEAMPDTVELTATVSGSAELAADAVEKYRGNKRRAIQALNGLKLKGFTVVGSGPSINSGTTPNPMAALQAGQANKPKVTDKVAVQERLTMTLSGINTMSAEELLQSLIRIIDVTKDAGLAIGPGPQGMIAIQLTGAKPASLATFKLSDTDSLRPKAYQAAIQQARAKAGRLAQLAGVQLGDVISIQEPEPALKSDNSSGGGLSAYFALLGMASNKEPDYTSTEFQTIPVTVTLNVQFDIVKKH
jgi:uncharacterized protein YggE